MLSRKPCRIGCLEEGDPWRKRALSYLGLMIEGPHSPIAEGVSEDCVRGA